MTIDAENKRTITVTTDMVHDLYRMMRFCNDRGMVFADTLFRRIKNENLPEEVDNFFEELGTDIDTLLFLARIFSGNFVDGIPEGPGFGLDVDENGNATMILDVIKVRNKIASAEDQYQTLRSTNGSLITSTSAKLRFVRKKEM